MNRQASVPSQALVQAEVTHRTQSGTTMDKARHMSSTAASSIGVIDWCNWLLAHSLMGGARTSQAVVQALTGCSLATTPCNQSGNR